jgi:ribonucleoside-triphosphate reductase
VKRNDFWRFAHWSVRQQAYVGQALGLDKLADTLDSIRDETIRVNAEIADAMGINRSAAITTVKPSGTVSQLTGTSSGMHPWHSDHYLRTVRQDNKDPLTSFMRRRNYNEPTS